MRYRMVVLVRAEKGPNAPIRIDITASTEEQARRIAIGRAMREGLIVSRFLDIRKTKEVP